MRRWPTCVVAASALATTLLLAFLGASSVAAPPDLASLGETDEAPHAGAIAGALAVRHEGEAGGGHVAAVDAEGQGRGAGRAGPLSLTDVLKAVESHDPRLEAARREVERAGGKLLSAEGAFDPLVWAEHMQEPLYGSGLSRVRVDQQTRLHGLSAWAAYQLGTTARGGVRPVNCSMPGLMDLNGCGRQITATGGEVFLGMNLPLLQGGATDRRRTDLASKELEQARTEAMRDATRLKLRLEAAASYWRWVSAGLAMGIEQRLLALAETRQEKLVRQIALGLTDRLAEIENRRLILDRRARLVTAERALQQAALALSLFLRDAKGRPVLVGAERLPSRMPALPTASAGDREADVTEALGKRPEPRGARRSLEQTQLELQLARNNRLPRVDLSGLFSHELGREYSVDPAELTPLPTELVTWLTVSVPLPMRAARGQEMAARAEKGRLAADLRMLEDVIAVEVADARVALEAAHRQAGLATEQVGLATELAAAELKRFELGDGDLMRVNLRELAMAEAATEEVNAIAACFIAMAALEAAKGEGLPAPER
jgi:cobalt-zinc-cadmium efflux system outer membrane protein